MFRRSQLAVPAIPNLKPKRVVTIPCVREEAPPPGMQDVPFSGIASKFSTQNAEIWLLMVQESAAESVVGTLLALFLVNEAETIVPLEFMPMRPPHAMLLDNGIIRTTRGNLLPDWALKEIGRVRGLLLQEHSGYVSDVVSAVKLESSSSFRKVPPGEIWPIR